jgi:hypothetical protein
MEFANILPNPVNINIDININIPHTVILPSVSVPLTFDLSDLYSYFYVYNTELLALPVRSGHSWQRIKRLLGTDYFQCKKCGIKSSRSIGLKPRSKITPDCNSVIISQVLWV